MFSWEPPLLEFVKVNFNGNIRVLRVVQYMSSGMWMVDFWRPNALVSLSLLSQKSSLQPPKWASPMPNKNFIQKESSSRVILLPSSAESKIKRSSLKPIYYFVIVGSPFVSLMQCLFATSFKTQITWLTELHLLLLNTMVTGPSVRRRSSYKPCGTFLFLNLLDCTHTRVV